MVKVSNYFLFKQKVNRTTNLLLCINFLKLSLFYKCSITFTEINKKLLNEFNYVILVFGFY